MKIKHVFILVIGILRHYNTNLLSLAYLKDNQFSTLDVLFICFASVMDRAVVSDGQMEILLLTPYLEN